MPENIVAKLVQTPTRTQELNDIANRLRIWSIKSTTVAGTGHPTSCCSMAEIMSVLFFRTMKYKVNEPRDPSSDRFVLSKGHGAPILYAAWAEAGLFKHEEMLNLRKIDCDLEGHPTPRLNFVDVATGSLGQGLSCAVGMAYTGKYFDKASYRVYCVVGDGESAEGSIWEALAFASHYKLDNLVVIFDVNRFGQSEPTAYAHKTEVYEARVKAFGLDAVVVDGHDVNALEKAFDKAQNTKGVPTAVIAKTFKGHGIDGMSDVAVYHGKIVPAEKMDRVINVIEGKITTQEVNLCKPLPPQLNDAKRLQAREISLSEKPNYEIGEKVATRGAYGKALVKLGTNDQRIIALDGDMRCSTYSEMFRKAFPERFIEGYIAEQNIVGAAIGCGCRGRTIPFMSTYAAFLSRAFDQIRMGAISQGNVKFVGSHAGVSVGPDGPSQMGLEDLSMFRSIPNITVFYPSDAVSTERACELAANIDGMCYIRTSRPELPVLYSNDECFEVGKAKIVRENNDDCILIVAAAVTMAEAIKAANELMNMGISARILDPFTIKPIDAETISYHAQQVGGRVITVEDHYAEGGLGEAVSAAIADQADIKIKIMAVRGVPRSGTPAGLLEKFRIDSSAIIEEVHTMLSN